MNVYARSLKETLTSLIREMATEPAPYVKHPGKDFTRKKKLPFETVMQLLISMGGNSLYKELLESQGYDVNTATTSAFVQQRNKILRLLWNACFTGLRVPILILRLPLIS